MVIMWKVNTGKAFEQKLRRKKRLKPNVGGGCYGGSVESQYGKGGTRMMDGHRYM